jgi:hypothetical protein
MSIHFIKLSGTDEFAPEDHSVRIWVTGRTDLLKLQALIHRALNTAPEFGAEWFKLADDLEKFIAEQGIK